MMMGLDNAMYVKNPITFYKNESSMVLNIEEILECSYQKN